jgi:hypothetical protein
MADRREHRGPHPEDAALFADDQWPALQAAVHDVSWLLTRAYAWDSVLKLVGDRYRLTARQRRAVQRSACSDSSLQRRSERCRPLTALAGCTVHIDGLNLLTTVEAMLAGGVLLSGRDGCLRDMASVHGTYRQVAETEPAMRLIGDLLAALAPARCTWWLDRPVSNSGRVSQRLLALAQAAQWPWDTRLVADPDRELKLASDLVITADSVILDQCTAWVNLTAALVAHAAHDAWIVPMAHGEGSG